MLRRTQALCAATFAVVVILGVAVLLERDGAEGPLRIPARSPEGPAAVTEGSTAVEAAVLERPVPPPAAPELAGPAAEEASEQRERIQLETVTLFDHGLHADPALGQSWQVGIGWTSWQGAFANDSVSCLEIPSGLQVTLFDGEEGDGYRLTLGPGTFDLLPLAFNDRTSSIRVSRYGAALDAVGPEDAAVLYEHRGADLKGRGQAWRLEIPKGRGEWTFLASRGDFDDNQASTAWIPLGHELVLFDSLEPYGIAVVLGPGLHELEHFGFNDRASAVRARR